MKKKTAKSKHRKKIYTPKGRLGAGMAYVILAILIIVAGGSLMTGNIIPISSTSPTSGQPVIIIPPQTKPAKDDLQLFTFPAATYTPTPSPTSPPQPQITSPGSGKGPGSATPVPGVGGGGIAL